MKRAAPHLKDLAAGRLPACDSDLGLARGVRQHSDGDGP
jgi:hypothetical protein